jgi:CheY-like chemotaxis protein
VAVVRVHWNDDADAAAVAAVRESQPSGRPITVVLADDQRLLRTGFRVILEAESDITVVGEAADGRGAVDVVRRRRPDAVLMDNRMPSSTAYRLPDASCRIRCSTPCPQLDVLRGDRSRHTRALAVEQRAATPRYRVRRRSSPPRAEHGRAPCAS